MEFLSILERLWPFAVALLGLIVWSVRLEADLRTTKSAVRSLASALAGAKEDIKEVEEKVHAQVAELQRDMRQILASVARIEGFLSYKTGSRNPE